MTPLQSKRSRLKLRCTVDKEQQGALAVACFISIASIFIQFFTPVHVNGMLLVGKLTDSVALA